MSQEKSELLALSFFNNNQEPDLIKSLFESIEFDNKDRVKELLTRNPELALKKAQFTTMYGFNLDCTPLEHALCRTPDMFDVMLAYLSPNELVAAIRIKSQYLELKQQGLSNFNLDSFYETVRAYKNSFSKRTVEEREVEYKKVESQLPEYFRQPVPCKNGVKNYESKDLQSGLGLAFDLSGKIGAQRDSSILANLVKSKREALEQQLENSLQDFEGNSNSRCSFS